MGKQRKYIYIYIHTYIYIYIYFFFSYFGMFSDYIHDLDFFLVCLVFGC